MVAMLLIAYGYAKDSNSKEAIDEPQLSDDETLNDNTDDTIIMGENQ